MAMHKPPVNYLIRHDYHRYALRFGRNRTSIWNNLLYLIQSNQESLISKHLHAFQSCSVELQFLSDAVIALGSNQSTGIAEIFHILFFQILSLDLP